ncbi:glycosyltransferase [Prosthecobacter sp.]|uniref:glycosyltransferase family 32 protein n=1 Tax=Prosthecobacter sp. TaxID=1965333 RepID=UPI002ABD0AD0|nr:glycosyltransferase [Prosthecobacter sp.]MDZ4404014.1 glycosyltransferase [Prosthecobacter sp.]
MISKKLFQTWHTKVLSPGMQASVDALKAANPDFEHYLYDDADCRAFIQEHFPTEVADAFDALVPGAYKADLWRYCVLHVHGGIYLDIKFRPLNGFRFSELEDKEYFCRDLDDTKRGTLGIYNAILICRAGNPILKQCIDQIVRHVEEDYYGFDYLCPTGPALIGRFFLPTETFELRLARSAKHIEWRNRPILEIYKGYRRTQKKEAMTRYYEAWRRREIYARKGLPAVDGASGVTARQARGSWLSGVFDLLRWK